MEKVSIVVPVHNGSEWIQKLVKNILNQDYENIEILLIENFSGDDSWAKANEMQDKYPEKVKAYQCTKKGTSQARRLGIELASGEYIVFADQDDGFISKSSIRKMKDAISEDGSEIVQFGFYIDDVFGIKRKKLTDDQRHIYSREEFIKSQAGGLVGCGPQTNSNFSTPVWNKIYKAEVLKDTANKIKDELYYAEDLNLCLHTFFNKKTLQVSYRPECYYAWKKGVGFSSNSNSGWTLMKEYQIVKPYFFTYAKEYNISDDILWHTHVETLYLFKLIIEERITSGEDFSEIEEMISEMLSMEHVIEAKRFLINYHGKQAQWDELRFLYEDHTPDEYYEYCLNNTKCNKKDARKEILKGFYKDAMSITRFFQKQF